MWRALLLALGAAGLLGGCLRSNLVSCGDRLCPVGTKCDDVHATCVEAGQLTACASVADGEPCAAAATAGICDQGVCLPGCGDGVRGDGEECDDGNFRSHDGCSSSCNMETATWSKWTPPFVGISGHAAAYDRDRQLLVVVGGTTAVGVAVTQRELGVDGVWRLRPGSPPRVSSALAYDELRKRMVMFGGTDSNGVASNETWEYDGAQWAKASPTASPPPRYFGAMIYDRDRKVLVYFGGISAIGLALDETWEYDGTTWTQNTAPPHPGLTLRPAFAWDDARHVAVLFGAPGGSTTWQYAGGTWTSASGPGPAVRGSASLAFSPGLDKIVLFSGALAGGTLATDTWQFDGTWKQMTPLTSPAGRWQSAIAPGPSGGAILVGGAMSSSQNAPGADVWRYDAAGWTSMPPSDVAPARAAPLARDSKRGSVFVFGGVGLGRYLNDSWTFDGVTWTQLPLSTAPVTHNGHSLLYDGARDRFIVFGGLDGMNNVVDDTYELDPGQTSPAWVNRSELTVRPPARELAGMVYDGHVTTLFGGAAGTTLFDDTWEYDGNTWQQITTSISPKAGVGSQFAYDLVHQRSVLAASDGTTWTYADHAWTMLDANAPVRSAAALAFDPSAGKILRFGGTAYGAGLTNELWELDDDGWHQLSVAGELPPGRNRAGMAAFGHGVVLFGGNGANNVLEDTWLLERTSSTPDEICDNGIDDDGDRQVDDADPDCN